MTGDPLALLRAAVYDGHLSQETWRAVTEAVMAVPSDVSAVAVDYVAQHLGRADLRRHCPPAWAAGIARGEPGQHLALVDSLDSQFTGHVEAWPTLIDHLDIRHIQVRDRRIARRWLVDLLRHPSSAQLRSLELACSAPPGAVAIIAEADCGNLERLSLQGSTLSGADLGLLAHHPVFSGLRHLDVRSCDIADHDARSIGRAFRARGNASLVWHANAVSPTTRGLMDPALATQPAFAVTTAGRRWIALAGDQLTFGVGSRNDVCLQRTGYRRVHFTLEFDEHGFEAHDLSGDGVDRMAGRDDTTVRAGPQRSAVFVIVGL